MFFLQQQQQQHCWLFIDFLIILNGFSIIFALQFNDDNDDMTIPIFDSYDDNQNDHYHQQQPATKYEQISVKMAKYLPIVTTGQSQPIENFMNRNSYRSNRLRFDDNIDSNIDSDYHHQHPKQSFLFQPINDQQPQQKQSKRKYSYKLFDVYPEMLSKQQQQQIKQRQQQLTPKMIRFYERFDEKFNRNSFDNNDNNRQQQQRQQQIHLLVDPEYYQQQKLPLSSIGTSTVGTDMEPINLPVITRRQPPIYVGQPPPQSNLEDNYFKDFYQSLEKFYTEQQQQQQRRRRRRPNSRIISRPQQQQQQQQQKSTSTMTMMMMMMPDNDNNNNNDYYHPHTHIHHHHQKYPIIS